MVWILSNFKPFNFYSICNFQNNLSKNSCFCYDIGRKGLHSEHTWFANADKFSRANMALMLPVLLTALLSTHTIRHQMFDISWWTLAISVQYVPSIKSTQLHNNLVNPNTFNFWWMRLLKLKQIWGNSNAETIRTFTPNVTTCHITWTQQSWWLTIWVIHNSSSKLVFLRQGCIKLKELS